MNITSIEFAVFTLVVLGIYYLVPLRLQNYVLLIASYFFLISWNLQFALVYFLLTIVNYCLALYLGTKRPSSQYVLLFGILLNLMALVFFKYSNFFVPSALIALERLGVKSGIGTLNILLPIGLSFYIVQVISYLLDVSRGLAKPSTNPINFAIYMAYFPRVVSGPIERSREFLPLLEKKRQFDLTMMGEGLTLLLQGLIRKIVVADLLSIIIPSDIFVVPQKYSAPELAVWLLAYAFAIYNDFAGYTLIVRGISQFFGLPLAANFNTPYFARNFTELWRRWHITLSDWLRDYIFIPVTRFLMKRKYSPTSIICIVIPPMITMLVSAVWHNLGWGMLLWGALHGSYLVCERVLALSHPSKPMNAQPYWRQFLGIALVFLLTILAWVPFRAELPATLQYWGGLFSVSNWISSLSNFAFLRNVILNKYLVDIIALVGLSLILDLAAYRFGEQAIRRLSIPVQALIINLAFFLLVAATIAQSVPPPFVYQGF